ncbi:MAG: radical SAM protein [Candidatus Omnitrophota bacterium]|jgi:radical SAM protein with 4Fe4S-binding SPASM domain
MQSCHKAEYQFNTILAKVEERKIPLWAHLDLTYRCNQDCIHCYCQGLSESFPSNQKELSTGEIFSLLDQLSEVGSLYLTLSGGEVFLRRDFFKIARYARKKNFALNIFTNATLIDDTCARRIAELSPLCVEMSVYGSTAAVHDAITRRPGSFEELCRAVKSLKDNHLKVVLKSAIMNGNVHQEKEIEEFCYQIGAQAYRFTMELSCKNDGSPEPKQYQINEGQIRSMIARANIPLSEKKHGYWDKPLEKLLCGTGVIGCYISPYGDVYPCIQLLIPMGNIRKMSFREIWQSPSALRKELDNLRTYADMPDCLDCRYIRFCKKCLGLAYLEKKDVKACYDTLRCISKVDYELYNDRIS